MLISRIEIADEHNEEWSGVLMPKSTKLQTWGFLKRPMISEDRSAVGIKYMFYSKTEVSQDLALETGAILSHCAAISKDPEPLHNDKAEDGDDSSLDD
jgi:hypothetical protein